MTEFFIKLPKHILYADGYYTGTGERVSLALSDKIIYSYMLDKQMQFAKEKGLVHFESQSTIARYTRLSLKTVQRTLSKFISTGVVHASKVPNRAGGLPHWQYTGVKHPLPTWVKDDEGVVKQINKTMCDLENKNSSQDEGLDLPW